MNNLLTTAVITLSLLLSLAASAANTPRKDNPSFDVVVIDESVPDKQVFYQGLKPGAVIHEVNSSADGLQQLSQILAGYKNITGLHIVSHAQDGEILLVTIASWFLELLQDSWI